MKRYVFFTCSVFGIGGGQRYVSNKTEYLKEKGYDVCSISTSIFSPKGKIFYKGLHQSHNYVLTELRFHPDAYGKHKAKRIIKKVAELIGTDDCDEIILESNYLTSSVWAERVARCIKAKHIIYSVSEENTITAHMRDFLEFKVKRGEFATISTKSVKELLSKSKAVTEQNLQILHPNLGDPIEDITDERIESFERGDCNICVIGRGEKRYVEYACQEIVKFSQRHRDKQFSVALVSQFNSRLDARIHALFDTADNVKCYYWGYFAPFPRKLFEMFDLYIGGAGCATLPYRQNVLTLAMDLYNDKALGLIGYDGCTSACPANTQLDMTDHLENVFFEKNYLNMDYVPVVAHSNDNSYDSHMQFIDDSSNDLCYYTVVDKNIGLKEIVKTNMPFLVRLYAKISNRKK